MPFDGNGNYLLPTPAYPAVTGTTIEAADWNTVVEDVQAALTKAITRDGQSPALADIPLGGFRLTKIGAGVQVDDAMQFGQRFSATGGSIAAPAYTKPVPVTPGPTTTIVAASSNVFTVNLNQNITLAITASNPDGQTISIRFAQDATGSRTVTLPAGVTASGTINPTAGRISWLTLTYTSLANGWEGSWMSV